MFVIKFKIVVTFLWLNILLKNTIRTDKTRQLIYMLFFIYLIFCQSCVKLRLQDKPDL